ncbi:MAG: formyltransferase family protein [Candidatus Sulfotelmatobacter sp.]|jgi:folate-dependent phosphoribosylglycinamide formyltransferase PurN
MRIVILAPNVYSETACAMSAHLAESGCVPVGALTISTLHPRTLARKIGQWGLGGAARYAFEKLIPLNRHQSSAQNPYLEPMLQHGGSFLRSLKEVAAHYSFPLALCQEMNSSQALSRLTKWSPDLIIFTGGNILRRPLLDIPRLGVLNVHLALLPQIRGMSSPEWSLLENVPVGITIHFMDAGIDTGPILKKYEFLQASECNSLSDLRHRLIAFGVTKVAEVVAGLDRGQVSAQPQSDFTKDENQDRQFFVMHDWLRTKAAESLVHHRTAAGITNG